MDKLTIKTSGREYAILCWDDLTTREQGEFDYLDEQRAQEDASFVRYRGVVYDLNEFSVCPVEMKPWNGYRGDSFFSGVVVRYTDDFNGVFVGTYFS